MPGYQGHLAGGTATFFLMYYSTTKVLSLPGYNEKELALAFAFCILGSLFPDIDTKSFGQKIFYFFLAIIILLSIINGHTKLLVPLSLISVFPLLVNHRGIIHTVWFVTLAPLSIPFVMGYSSPQFTKITWLIYSYFVVGALSHLLLDYGFLRLLKRTFGR